ATYTSMNPSACCSRADHFPQTGNSSRRCRKRWYKAVMAENTLYYGDNLEILRRYVKDESVDLIYLDPPFNSNVDYNVLFKERDGKEAASQIKAFKDSWTWTIESEESYVSILENHAPHRA